MPSPEICHISRYAKTARKYNVDVDRKKGNNLKDFPIETARYRKRLPFLLFEVALLVGYGWVVHSHVHPSVPLIMQFFICGTSTLLSHTASALLVDIFPDMSSTAYASGQIMRCGLSAALVAVLQPLVDAVGRGWYFTIFALFVGISGLVSLVTSQLKGMQWREKRQEASAGEAPCSQKPDEVKEPAALRGKRGTNSPGTFGSSCVRPSR